MLTANRRYDIDWLRVIAIGLLLIYHMAIGFQPWGSLIGFIKTEPTLESMWIPMAMLNVWRIPLLFFVSGMGVCFAMRKRNWKELLLERSKRILLPFVFGIFAIVPLHIFLWQDYYRQDLSYIPDPAHLWFLGNIFIYVLILSPIFFYLKRNDGGAVQKMLNWVYKSPLGLLIITGAFMIETALLQPNPYELYASTPHGFWMGLVAFFFGFTAVYSGENFWKTVLKWKWLFLAIGASLYFTRLFVYDLQAPNMVMAVESTMWVFAVFGFGYQYLNRPSKALSYLSPAIYPIYIIHMAFQYLGSYLLFPLEMNVVVKLAALVVFTFGSSLLVYEFIIRRVVFLRPLFGLKVKLQSEKKTNKHLVTSQV